MTDLETNVVSQKQLFYRETSGPRLHTRECRRWYALALCSGVTLLLLTRLLHREPPARFATAHWPPYTTAAARVASNSSSSSLNHSLANVTSSAVVDTHKHTNTGTHKDTQVDNLKKEQIVITRDLYESGHLWAHPELCPELGADIQLLILVTSAPAHTTERDGIRSTWRHFAQRRDVAIAFVLGRVPDGVMQQVSGEDALYGDIIMGTSWDSYSNLTLKVLSMLEWTATHCPRARYLLKTDDDVFINVRQLLAFIAHPERANATKTIWGRVEKHWVPFRNPNSKYYLARKQYPLNVLPRFATGPAYLVTGDAVRPLLAAAPTQPYVRLEDVFVTGILADIVGVRRVKANEFYNEKVLDACAVQRGISIHGVRYGEQFDLWRMLLGNQTQCSSRLNSTYLNTSSTYKTQEYTKL